MHDFVPKSGLEGLVWPALPGPQSHQILAILDQIERSQWWAAEALEARQFAQLGRLLAHAAKTVPFYGQRLRAAGVVTGQPLTPEVWSRIPLLTRAEIRAAGAGLHSARLPDDHGGALASSSSRHAEIPIKVQRSRIALLYGWALMLRAVIWSGVDLSWKRAIIRRDKAMDPAPPQGRATADWGSPYAAAFPTGPGAVLDKRMDTAARARFLLEHRPDFLTARPSILKDVAEHFRDRGLTLPTLKALHAYGEVLEPEVRDLCRSIWGVEIADSYRTRHMGDLAQQCPTGTHYHVHAEGNLIEILDDDGRPCAPGAVGRVVVTPLHNYAMPFIRHDIGDYAEAGRPCDCGRGLPVIARILGHKRNMIALPDGTRRLPGGIEGIFVDFPPVAQGMVIQHGLDDIEVLVVPRRPLDPSEEAVICERARAVLGHSFPMRVTCVDALPRTRGSVGAFRSMLVQ